MPALNAIPPGTRAEGLARLAAFLPHAWDAYDRHRNFAVDTWAVSRLSPYLQRRLIDPGEVIESVLRVAPHPKASVDGGKFLQEVAWRTYWKGWLAHHPQVWQRYVSEAKRLARAGGGLAAAQDQACRSATGIACFDAWSRELVETGYLHNHVRMWFASIWIHTLRLPWQLGAAFFMRHLLDGDAASNTLSWRWVAGLQTRGKAYLATSENIAKYTRGEFSHTPNLATEAFIEPESQEVSMEQPVVPPLVAFAELAKTGTLGLVVTLDDMTIETTAAGTWSVACVVIVTGSWTQTAHARSSAVDAFDAAAAADARTRCAAKYGCPVILLEPTAAAPQPADLRRGLQEVADAHGIESWRLARPQIGPIGDLLDVDAHYSGHAAFSPFTRPHDLDLFPAATRGYFHLKKRLPKYFSKVAIKNQ